MTSTRFIQMSVCGWCQLSLTAIPVHPVEFEGVRYHPGCLEAHKLVQSPAPGSSLPSCPATKQPATSPRELPA